jgi:hypothetical protein
MAAEEEEVTLLLLSLSAFVFVEVPILLEFSLTLSAFWEVLSTYVEALFLFFSLPSQFSLVIPFSTVSIDSLANDLGLNFSKLDLHSSARSYIPTQHMPLHRISRCLLSPSTSTEPSSDLHALECGLHALVSGSHSPTRGHYDFTRYCCQLFVVVLDLVASSVGVVSASISPFCDLFSVVIGLLCFVVTNVRNLSIAVYS